MTEEVTWLHLKSVSVKGLTECTDQKCRECVEVDTEVSGWEGSSNAERFHRTSGAIMMSSSSYWEPVSLSTVMSVCRLLASRSWLKWWGSASLKDREESWSWAASWAESASSQWRGALVHFAGIMTKQMNKSLKDAHENKWVANEEQLTEVWIKNRMKVSCKTRVYRQNNMKMQRCSDVKERERCVQICTWNVCCES